jgi:hypothetical protein
MQRSKKRKGKAKKQVQQPLPPAPRKSFPALAKIGAGILGLCTIVGTLVGLVVLLPRMTVDSDKLVDPLNAPPITFTLTNTGYIPLTNVRPAMGLCDFVIGPPRDIDDRCDGSLSSGFQLTKWFTKRLSMDEKHTIRLDDLFDLSPPTQFGGANISIKISYEPWFLWFRMEKEFRFMTRMEKDGKFSWVNRPINR